MAKKNAVNSAIKNEFVQIVEEAINNYGGVTGLIKHNPQLDQLFATMRLSAACAIAEDQLHVEAEIDKLLGECE